MLVCVFLCMFAHETAGAARTRSSLRPLFSEGEDFPHNSGASRRGIEQPCLPSLRGAKRRSNPFLLCRPLDCFASLAMTVCDHPHSAAFAVLPNIRVGAGKPHDVPSVTLT